jgi:CotH protein
VAGSRLAAPAAAALATFLLIGGAFASPALATLSADSMLDPGTVAVIDLQLPPASVAALEADPSEYVEGTFALAETGGTPATIGAYSTPITVGIRLKGGATFQGLDGKAAFKLKFNEFVKGQKFLGLKKLTLNSMLQDPSMLHEVLAYDAFRAVGVAASHTGYAYVYVNGVDYGLHLNLETIDDVALEARFGPLEDNQHLYEGAYGSDVVPSGAAAFEVDEGDEEDRSDLEALIAAAAATEPDFPTRMEAVANLDQMTRMWAAERYLGHWDGYSAPAVNNYYLFSDATGSFQMLPWGTDQALVSWWMPFSSSGGVLFEQCLDDEECGAAYVDALATTRTTVAGLNLVGQAGQIAALLAPWQAKEIAEGSRAPYGAEEIEDAVADTIHFLEVRPQQLNKFLGIEEAPPPTVPGPAPEPALPILAPESVPGLSQRLEVDRSKLGRGLLITRVAAPAAGTVRQLARIVTAAGPLQACVTEAKATAASTTTLRCRLSGVVRKRLAVRRLVLQLETRFEPEAGTGSAFSTPVVMPRQG